MQWFKGKDESYRKSFSLLIFCLLKIVFGMNNAFEELKSLCIQSGKKIFLKNLKMVVSSKSIAELMLQFVLAFNISAFLSSATYHSHLAL
jgi:hypothetical protein